MLKVDLHWKNLYKCTIYYYYKTERIERFIHELCARERYMANYR